MSKRKERSELEHLRGIIKKLTAELKKLKKQLRNNKTKKSNREEELELELQEIYMEEEFNTKIDYCKDCKTEVLQTVDLGIRKMLICNKCGNKKVTKNG